MYLITSCKKRELNPPPSPTHIYVISFLSTPFLTINYVKYTPSLCPDPSKLFINPKFGMH